MFSHGWSKHDYCPPYCSWNKHFVGVMDVPNILLLLHHFTSRRINGTWCHYCFCSLNDCFIAFFPVFFISLVRKIYSYDACFRIVLLNSCLYNVLVLLRCISGQFPCRPLPMKNEVVAFCLSCTVQYSLLFLDLLIWEPRLIKHEMYKWNNFCDVENFQGKLFFNSAQRNGLKIILLSTQVANFYSSAWFFF
jgi:hypothetical protein